MSKIALDVDSTLSATTEKAFEVLAGPDHTHTYGDLEHWDWPIEKWGADQFLNAVHGAWMHEPLNIPTMERGLGYTIEKIREDHTVDIVTHQPQSEQVSRGKKAWLAYHGIEYDDFVAVDRDVSKAELDYDVYIDDKPSLPVEVAELNPDATMLLRHQRYNREAEGNYQRVYSVSGACVCLNE